ncbi:MAG: hypothetical protein J6D03_04280 [Clostridia bacterium]|nr:hypothetical protein [Clostridia bacterium]
MNIEKYLSNFFKGTKNPSLKAMKFLMEEFKHPEDELKAIHIAGTNGKGSVTEMITNVLIKEGYTVGKFISPHLIQYNERISVNNENITNIEMEKLINKINPSIEKYNSQNDIPVTLFELETTMAFLYFKEKNCDFVVLETGLGGLYDCTNIINNPLVSVITSIGYDHMHILGNTLPEIAYQKAGIIKENSNTVIFNQESDINNVFITECKNKNNILHIVNKSDISNYSFDNNFQYFDYKNFKNIIINLKGKVQVQNACLCIEVFKILNELGYHVNPESIQIGLKTVIHRGRMEQINDKPIIIYDGAHNEPAIKNLQDMVKMYYSKMKRVYIISILKRKDYNKMLKLIAEDKEAVFILTSGNNSETYASSDELYECLKKFADIDKIYKKSLDDAINRTMNSDLNTANFIIGSFYTYGTVIDIIKNK